jgi:MtN3 and saliva related transmembrane protein
MSHDLTTYLGGLAAFLASLSYVPQVRKAWPRGSTADLSMGMLVALTTGLALWVVSGAMREHWVIIAANAVGASLAGIATGVRGEAKRYRNDRDWSKVVPARKARTTEV